MNRSTLALMAAMIAVAAVALGVQTADLIAPDQWDPIDGFPDQTIIDVTGTHVTVDGEKCYHEPVRVIGQFGWQSVDPPGVVVPVGQGTADRDPGCEQFTFENPIPTEVRRHNDVRLWVITGTETPIDTEGSRQGLPHAWRTEPFALEPTG